MEGSSTEERLEWLGLQSWIHELVSISIFFMAAFFIARKFVQPNYWKIALALVAIAVITFHIGYIAWCVDYYWIKGLTPEPKDPMEQLLSMVTFTGPPSEPVYQPIEAFFQPFILLTYEQFRDDYSYVFFNFLFGTLTKPLWISAVAYYVLKKRRGKISKVQSTLDNE
jgi:hypothetical protein